MLKKQLPYCLNYLARIWSDGVPGDSYFILRHQNFKTIGDAFRFVRDLKNGAEETCDRYLYKREGRRGFNFVNEY